MDYIFNELSIKEVDNIHTARNILTDFVKTCSKVRSSLSLETLRIPESIGNLYNVFLTKDYPVSKWCHDHEIDHDIRQKFYLIIANPPLLNNDEITELDTFETSYFNYNAHESKGLGVAFLLETLAVSFSTENCWDTNDIIINHEYFDDNDEVVTNTINIKHGSKVNHIDTHIDYFNEKRRSIISKCSEIWDQRETLFPNLIFCGKTRKQLTNGLSSKYVYQIYDRLLSLNEYIKTWQSGEFNVNDFVTSKNIKCSTESECTLRLYGDQRRFSIPEKGSELFSLHIKTGDLRFHFYPDSSIKKAYIGYIGSHLETCTG
jgi:hypothetical protein